jgi:hypothetical protein
MVGGFRGHEADAGMTMFSAINCSASFGLSRAVIIPPPVDRVGQTWRLVPPGARDVHKNLRLTALLALWILRTVRLKCTFVSSES